MEPTNASETIAKHLQGIQGITGNGFQMIATAMNGLQQRVERLEEQSEQIRMAILGH